MHLEGGGTDLTSFSVLLVWNLLELTDALMSHTKASEAKRTRATLHREASHRRRNGMLSVSNGTVLLVNFVQCAALLLPLWPELRPPAVKGVLHLFSDTGSGASEDRASGSVSSPKYLTWLCLALWRTALLFLALRLRCPCASPYGGGAPFAPRLSAEVPLPLHQPEAALVLPVAPGLDRPGVPALSVDSRECSTQRGKLRVQLKRPFWPQQPW